MAAKRITKSAVDWVAFAEHVPQFQFDGYRALKAKSDSLFARMHRYPEKLPSIDFAHYKLAMPIPGLVDKFESAYKNITIQPPIDKDNLKKQIDEQEKLTMKQTDEYVAKIVQEAKFYREASIKCRRIPPEHMMTKQVLVDYFPESRLDPENPVNFPGTKQWQSGVMPDIDHPDNREWMAKHAH